MYLYVHLYVNSILLRSNNNLISQQKLIYNEKQNKKTDVQYHFSQL